MTSVFIFRRDFRLIDNLGLIKTANYCLKHGLKILPVFIYNIEQVSKKNDYKSDNAIAFMVGAIEDLKKRLSKYDGKLYTFKSDNDVKVLKNISSKVDIKMIAFNSDYTPYAKKRDSLIEAYCKKQQIICCYYRDYLLSDCPSNLLKEDRNVYTTFTPFKNNAYNYLSKNKVVITPFKAGKNIFSKPKLSQESIDTKKSIIVPTRQQALKLLVKKSDYATKRNYLMYQTTRLSAYIKFGLVSIREVYLFYKGNKALTDQLLWREFYYIIFNYHPEGLTKKIMLKQKLKRINTPKWTTNNKFITQFTNGRTGNKLVDSCLNELFTTGYLHNRGRLIVSSYARLLGLNWTIGEKLFARHLIDYDPIVNCGNWLFQYGDIFNRRIVSQQLLNPEIQRNKFDKKGEYINKYLPKDYKESKEIIEYRSQKIKSNEIYSRASKK